ncbi:hypothetical protein [Microbacterium gorillae]|uniref:hypothetical protein n=1 Tax=Microbacterium gorillae TaxID=1231063 RepID=UPI00058C9E73|nr:hypothetical protein [Microbacterium gorillae]
MNDIVGAMRPELSRDGLGVGPNFPGIAPNPLLSGAARRRTAELRGGTLALGDLLRWHEVSSDGSPRVVLVFDVRTAEGFAFRGIADETLTITHLTRLREGQTMAVRYRPAVQDHYVALASDVDDATIRHLVEVIGGTDGR